MKEDPLGYQLHLALQRYISDPVPGSLYSTGLS